MTSCADCQPDIVTAFVQTTSRGIAAWVVQIVSLGRLTGGFIRADPCGPHSWARSADYQPHDCADSQPPDSGMSPDKCSLDH
jgi:hypothetical protein